MVSDRDRASHLGLAGPGSILPRCLISLGYPSCPRSLQGLCPFIGYAVAGGSVASTRLKYLLFLLELIKEFNLLVLVGICISIIMCVVSAEVLVLVLLLQVVIKYFML